MNLGKKVYQTLLVLAVIGLVAAGCNTIRGAGKDIQRGGEAIEETAEEVQKGN